MRKVGLLHGRRKDAKTGKRSAEAMAACPGKVNNRRCNARWGKCTHTMRETQCKKHSSTSPSELKLVVLVMDL
jgi:hypothetical protein